MDGSYFINIYDTTTKKTWTENFESYYLFRKRMIKLKHSKKLMVTSSSNLEGWSMEIKERMYVRTKDGRIGKVVDVFSMIMDVDLDQKEKRYVLDSSNVYCYCEEDIKKVVIT